MKFVTFALAGAILAATCGGAMAQSANQPYDSNTDRNLTPQVHHAAPARHGRGARKHVVARHVRGARHHAGKAQVCKTVTRHHRHVRVCHTVSHRR